MKILAAAEAQEFMKKLRQSIHQSKKAVKVEVKVVEEARLRVVHMLVVGRVREKTPRLAQKGGKGGEARTVVKES